jgi:hypothetical protein
MATQFRQLGPADADLLTSCLVDWHGGDAAALDPVQIRREAQRILSDDESWHAWLIQQGAVTAGYLVLNFRKSAALEAPRAYVAALYVTPALRYLRLGRSARQLVADLGQWLRVRVLDFDTEREDKHLHLPLRGGSAVTSRMLQAAL